MARKVFQYPCCVRLHDIDAAGVMFFASFLRLAHDAYEAFMAEIGFGLPELIRQGQQLPLVRSEADFLQPVRHGDKLEIELHIPRIGDTSFTVGYVFHGADGQEVARLQTRHVQLNPVNRRPLVLAEPLRQALRPYTL